MLGEKITNGTFFKDGVELSCLSSDFVGFIDEIYCLHVIDNVSSCFIPAKGTDYSAYVSLLKEFYFYFFLESDCPSNVKVFFDVLFSGEEIKEVIDNAKS